MAKKTPTPAAGLDPLGLPLTVNTRTLAVLTGVTETRLHQLVRDSRISMECKTPAGRWNTSKALMELFGYYRRQADKAKPRVDQMVEDQISIENLRSIRIKNARAARELLPRHIYVQTWGELLTIFKNRWINFAHKMGPRVFRAKDKVDAAAMLDDEIRDIFSGLQDPKVMEGIEKQIRDDEFPSDDPGSHHPAATADPAAGDLDETDA